MADHAKVRRGVGVSIMVAVLIYLVLVLWSNAPVLADVFSNANPWLVLAVFGCTLVGYVFRVANWQFYLKSLGFTNVPRWDSTKIFIGGFSMGITPGKVGELVRSYYLKERYGIPMTKTSSILLIDRLTDVIALLIIAAIGALKFAYGGYVLLLMSGIAASILIIFAVPTVGHGLIKALCKIKFLHKHEEKFFTLYDSTKSLTKPSRLLVITAISLCAWTMEATGFAIAFKALGIEAGYHVAFFTFAFSTLVGAMALLPGGLGLTEGTMTGLLLVVNIAKAPAAAATLLTRAATLWFGILLGLIATALLERQPLKK